MLDVPSYILGKKSGGGSNFQSKSVEITENGTTNIRPDTGYDALTNVNVTVNGILDTSDADAVASDMAIGKTAYVDGNKITGNVPVGSSLVSTNYAATNVDIYLDDLQVDTEQRITNQMFRTGDKISVYTPLTDVAQTVGASAGKIKKDEVICGVTGTYEGGAVKEKDVNFIDYDGTIVNSYTKDEFLALQSLPENPTHEGLTAQGWNWTLVDAQDYVSKYGIIDIGQLYTTDDGKTRFYITIPENNRLVELNYSTTGETTVNWGDGSSETRTASGETTFSHTYSLAGDYVISIASTNNIYFSGDRNRGISKIFDSGNLSITKKIELGSNINKLDGSNFNNFTNLETITTPSNMEYPNWEGFYSLFAYTSLKCYITPNYKNFKIDNGFNSSGNLERVVLSNKATSVQYGNYTAVRRIIVPESVSSSVSASYNYNIETIVLPNSASSGMTVNYNTVIKINIHSSALTTNLKFQNDYYLKEVIVNDKNYGDEVTLGYRIFYGCSSLEKINYKVILSSDENFYECRALKEIEISDNATSIPARTFYNCRTLEKVNFPATITSIGNEAFIMCYGMKKYDFSDFASIPTLGSSVFTDSIDFKIIVPDDLYEDWIVATNWSSYASHIIKKSDWEALNQ